jgi:hypothetical protein
MNPILVLGGLGLVAFLLTDKGPSTGGASTSAVVTDQGATITATGYTNDLIVERTGIPFGATSHQVGR